MLNGALVDTRPRTLVIAGFAPAVTLRHGFNTMTKLPFSFPSQPLQEGTRVGCQGMFAYFIHSLMCTG
jgi:hypothetical protein